MGGWGGLTLSHFCTTTTERDMSLSIVIHLKRSCRFKKVGHQLAKINYNSLTLVGKGQEVSPV